MLNKYTKKIIKKLIQNEKRRKIAMEDDRRYYERLDREARYTTRLMRRIKRLSNNFS